MSLCGSRPSRAESPFDATWTTQETGTRIRGAERPSGTGFAALVSFCTLGWERRQDHRCPKKGLTA
jgi:hypothetical protein